jgi:Arc/MetJ-type ribon-helix-helix transcriptional regulator
MPMKLVTVLLPEAYLEGLDELVRSAMYPSRSAAIRAAVRDLLKRELWTRREEWEDLSLLLFHPQTTGHST